MRFTKQQILDFSLLTLGYVPNSLVPVAQSLLVTGDPLESVFNDQEWFYGDVVVFLNQDVNNDLDIYQKDNVLEIRPFTPSWTVDSVIYTGMEVQGIGISSTDPVLSAALPTYLALGYNLVVGGGNTYDLPLMVPGTKIPVGDEYLVVQAVSPPFDLGAPSLYYFVKVDPSNAPSFYSWGSVYDTLNQGYFYVVADLVELTSLNNYPSFSFTIKNILFNKILNVSNTLNKRVLFTGYKLYF